MSAEWLIILIPYWALVALSFALPLGMIAGGVYVMLRRRKTLHRLSGGLLVVLPFILHYGINGLISLNEGRRASELAGRPRIAPPNPLPKTLLVRGYIPDGLWLPILATYDLDRMIVAEGRNAQGGIPGYARVVQRSEKPGCALLEAKLLARHQPALAEASRPGEPSAALPLDVNGKDCVVATRFDKMSSPLPSDILELRFDLEVSFSENTMRGVKYELVSWIDGKESLIDLYEFREPKRLSNPFCLSPLEHCWKRVGSAKDRMTFNAFLRRALPVSQPPQR